MALLESQISPYVHFALDNFHLKDLSGHIQDWTDFGSWVDKILMQDQSSLHSATVSKIKSLVAGETTVEGKARKIYQFLQDKVRYISIQIGIRGWQPMPVTNVDKLCYGDCKALTHYTKTLLDLVGVPSYYTLIHAGDDGRDFPMDFASFQGNHAILAIPNKDEITWLECMSQDTPYGFIGDFTYDRDALIYSRRWKNSSNKSIRCF